jgi:hypothetical protein
VTSSVECSLAPDWPIKTTGVTRAPNTGPPDPPTEAAAYSEDSEQKFSKKRFGKILCGLKRVLCERFVQRPDAG